MSWRKRYEKYKPGDKVRFINAISDGPEDYMNGDEGTLSHYSETTEMGELWILEEYDCSAYTFEFERIK